MKIIKRGKIENPTAKIVCYNCKSELEYTASDIHSDQREGNYIICPVCKSFISALTPLAQQAKTVNDYYNK